MKLVNLEPKKNQEIRDVIGERLRNLLSCEQPSLPEHLGDLLRRLDEIEDSPSIVPIHDAGALSVQRDAHFQNLGRRSERLIFP
jgi:hypothetical protein